MKPPEISPKVAAARAVYADHRAAGAVVARQLGDKRRLQRDLDTKQAKRLELTEREDVDAALRLVEGPEAAPLNPARVKEIASLGEAIPAHIAALPLMDRKIAEAQRAAEEALAPASEAILDVVDEIQEPALLGVREGLGGLSPVLTALLTADLIREKLLGSSYPVSADRTPPIAGGVAVRKLLAAIPKRFQSAALDIDAMERAAQRASLIIISQIEG